MRVVALDAEVCTHTYIYTHIHTHTPNAVNGFRRWQAKDIGMVVGGKRLFQAAAQMCNRRELDTYFVTQRHILCHPQIHTLIPIDTSKTLRMHNTYIRERYTSYTVGFQHIETTFFHPASVSLCTQMSQQPSQRVASERDLQFLFSIRMRCLSRTQPASF